MKKIGLIGAGARGLDSYAIQLKNYDLGAKITAVVEPEEKRRVKAAELHEIELNYVFDNEDKFYEQGKIVDAVIIANHDRDHFYSVMQCLELGYDILLEKPITPSKEELIAIKEKAKEKNCRIMVCHVLRYTPFYEKLKSILDSGVIGKIYGVDHTEYIGNYHMAHSFVRGSWRNKELSAPIILAKTCHDMDLLTWLVDSKYTSVHSKGTLNYFNKENAPVNSAQKCLECPLVEECIYSAKKFYLDAGEDGWIQYISADRSRENILKVLNETNYGSCVYKLDNNVCDHQTCHFTFESGVNVTFTVTAFHNIQGRFTRIFGSKGSIVADFHDNTIKVQTFVCRDVDEIKEMTYYPERVNGGHGGGDYKIMRDFVNFLNDKSYQPRTSIEQSIQSHLMSYDSETSRLEDRIVYNEN